MHVSWRSCPRGSVDSQPFAIRAADYWPAEGDLGGCFSWATLCNRANVIETGQEVFLSSILRFTVSMLICKSAGAIDLVNLGSVLIFTAFFITICYHTIYASPWIFPPLAFYGADLLLRLFRYRIKDATLTPIDKQMTIVRLSTVFSSLVSLLTRPFRMLSDSSRRL